MRKTKALFPLLLASAFAVTGLTGCGDDKINDGGTRNDASAAADSGTGGDGGNRDGGLSDGATDGGGRVERLQRGRRLGL